MPECAEANCEFRGSLPALKLHEQRDHSHAWHYLSDGTSGGDA